MGQVHVPNLMLVIVHAKESSGVVHVLHTSRMRSNAFQIRAKTQYESNFCVERFPQAAKPKGFRGAI
jgi:hypothetical protein